uniref:Reticulon n=1 Tax=Oryzias melastigma TaxID=30732 RepID=A0A3B3D7J5_ORYME
MKVGASRLCYKDVFKRHLKNINEYNDWKEKAEDRVTWRKVVAGTACAIRKRNVQLWSKKRQRKLEPASPPAEATYRSIQLINWREPKQSAAVFGLSLTVLISVASLSVISVVSYLLLACLCVTITFRWVIYKSVIQAIQKSDEGHPFGFLLEKDISISPEAVRELGDQCLIHLNHFTTRTRRLLLVEDLVDSLKVSVVL